MPNIEVQPYVTLHASELDQKIIPPKIIDTKPKHSAESQMKLCSFIDK
jgi:hypothetical protein